MDFRFANRKETNEQWIQDAIGDDYKKWHTHWPGNPASRVFIESPTGTGKSTFILDVLLPFAAANQKSVLYLGNRIALINQIKTEFLKRYPDTIPLDFKKQTGYIWTWDNGVVFDINSTSRFAVINYQAISGYLKNHFWDASNHQTGYLSYDYVIFDEAHFFLEDSLFNPLTAQIAYNVLPLFSASVFVFMSATIRESIHALDWMLELSKPAHPVQDVYDTLHRAEKNIWIYLNRFKKTYYDIVRYFSYDEILHRIGSEKGKWVVFVSSKKNGSDLKNRIERDTGKSAFLFTAEEKKKKAAKDLIKQEKTNYDVLIATKVIDNGINIKDAEVLHIVLPFCYETDFIQMLGRLRLNETSRATLYINAPSIKNITSRIYEINKKQRIILRAIRCIWLEEKEVRYLQEVWADNAYLLHELLMNQHYDGSKYNSETSLMQDLWMRGDNNTNNLFYINRFRTLKLNYLAVEKMQQQLAFLEELKKAERVCDQVYYNEACRWIRQQESEHAQTLKEFLKKHNQPISEAMMLLFYNEFQSAINQECSRDEKKKAAIANVRKGKTRRKKTMNDEMKILGCPYVIKKEKNCWVVCQLPSNEISNQNPDKRRSSKDSSTLN